MVSVKFVNYSAFSYVQYISYQVKTLTMMCVAGSIDGVHINRITARIVAEGYNEVDIKSSINKLCNWGLIYNTIDENLFQSSEEGYLSVLNDTTLQVIKAYSGGDMNLYA